RSRPRSSPRHSGAYRARRERRPWSFRTAPPWTGLWTLRPWSLPRRGSADALVDQRHQRADGLGRDHAGAGVGAQTGEAVLLRQHALRHRQEALQIELLIEDNAHVSLLEPLDGRGCQIDPPGDDRARLLSRLFQSLPDEGGDVAVLRADRLQVGVLLEIGGDDGHRQRAVVIHLGADLDVVHFQPGSLERVIESLVALAALGLGAKAVLEGLVPLLQRAVF